MFIAEVVETKTAYKSKQKDEDGNPLPLGSIQIRIGSHQSNIGQVRNVYARPAVFQRRIPLIGEQVLVMNGPTNDWSTSSNKGTGFMYYSPVNGVDDLVSHIFPKLWKRQGLAPGGSTAQRKADKEENYTFPKTPNKVDNLQPFDGDDLFEGRFGQSIRFGSTISSGDTSVYEKQPTWKGFGNADPILILRVKKTAGGSNKYTIEDLSKDESSIYLTSKQSLNNFKPGFDKNQDVKQIGNWSGGSQILIDSDRAIVNSKKNLLFLIGKDKAILTAKKVLFQSEKYKVDLDELMDFLKKWLDEDTKLAQGSAVYSTSAGPTSTASNSAKYTQLKSSDFNKFKQP